METDKFLMSIAILILCIAGIVSVNSIIVLEEEVEILKQDKAMRSCLEINTLYDCNALFKEIE